MDKPTFKAWAEKLPAFSEMSNRVLQNYISVLEGQPDLEYGLASALKTAKAEEQRRLKRSQADQQRLEKSPLGDRPMRRSGYEAEIRRSQARIPVVTKPKPSKRREGVKT